MTRLQELMRHPHDGQNLREIWEILMGPDKDNLPPKIARALWHTTLRRYLKGARHAA
jgi:hypothetical protein